MGSSASYMEQFNLVGSPPLWTRSAENPKQFRATSISLSSIVSHRASSNPSQKVGPNSSQVCFLCITLSYPQERSKVFLVWPSKLFIFSPSLSPSILCRWFPVLQFCIPTLWSLSLLWCIQDSQFCVSSLQLFLAQVYSSSPGPQHHLPHPTRFNAPTP